MAARNVKSFSSKAKKAKPIPFELEGEEFEAYGAVSGAVLLEFIEATGSENPSETARGLLGYLRQSMNAENLERFNKVIHDPEINVEMETLSEIVSYLVEERTNRPTEASSE